MLPKKEVDSIFQDLGGFENKMGDSEEDTQDDDDRSCYSEDSKYSPPSKAAAYAKKTPQACSSESDLSDSQDTSGRIRTTWYLEESLTAVEAFKLGLPGV